MEKKSGVSNKIGRDAGTGLFIPVEEAKSNPKTTVIETRQPPSKHRAKEEHKTSQSSAAARKIHAAPKKGSVSISVIRKSVAGVIASRKKAKIG